MSGEQDRIAKEIYGSAVTYNFLSAWAKAVVDAEVAGQPVSESFHQDPFRATLPNKEVSLIQKVANLENLLEQAKIENSELWAENEELKIQIGENDE